MRSPRLKLLVAAGLGLLFLVAYALIARPPTERAGEPQTELAWQLEPLQTTKQDPNLVTRLNKRLGWSAPTSGGDAGPSQSGTGQTPVLGIQRNSAGEQWIIAGQTGSIIRYAVGDTLPDGREVVAIEGDVIHLSFEGQESQLRIFSYTRPAAPSP